MPTLTRSEIISRLLNLRSYTAEELGADAFIKGDEVNHTPVLLIGIDTISDIINFLAEDLQDNPPLSGITKAKL
jgi:hypothetical protein